MLHYISQEADNNTYMRNIAIQSNLKLNEYGLYDKKNNKPILLKSEKDIFDYLKLDYKPPTQR